MDEAKRERRVAEWRVVQFQNPRELIDCYCKLTGAISGSQMPRGVSFSRMIDAIVDYEETTELALGLTKPPEMSALPRRG